jgi:hypothetical protein
MRQSKTPEEGFQTSQVLSTSWFHDNLRFLKQSLSKIFTAPELTSSMSTNNVDGES